MRKRGKRESLPDSSVFPLQDLVESLLLILREQEGKGKRAASIAMAVISFSVEIL